MQEDLKSLTIYGCNIITKAELSPQLFIYLFIYYFFYCVFELSFTFFKKEKKREKINK